jgi:hypothetical protein
MQLCLALETETVQIHAVNTDERTLSVPPWVTVWGGHHSNQLTTHYISLFLLLRIHTLGCMNDRKGNPINDRV